MNWQTIDKSCESTPFAFINTPCGNVRLWWSLRAGTYGHQVYAFAIGEDGKGHFYKTGGCGYDKEAAALEWAFRTLGKQPRGMRLGGESVPHEYKIGGNFYRIPKKHWIKVK